MSYKAWQEAVREVVELGGIRKQEPAAGDAPVAKEDVVLAQDTASGAAQDQSSFLNDDDEVEAAAAIKVRRACPCRRSAAPPS